MKLQTPKGFKDYLPQEALRREFVLTKIKEVFKKFGFEPLETPTLEYAETLKGKYGEEEKLIYEFKTKGGDEVALKYDLTVPLARVVAQYGPNGEQKLVFPFKRYQVQSAFRGENTQKGRYREFLQCDADIVGPSTPLSDAETLALVYEIYKSLGLEVIIKYNDRRLLEKISSKALPALDKLNKVGEEGFLEEMQSRDFSLDQAKDILNQAKAFDASMTLQDTIELYKKMGYPEDSLQPDGTMVRGLDYYTGLIIEVVLKSEPNGSSLGGGGRYDNLMEKFAGVSLGAVGFSVGLERTLEAMEAQGLLEDSLSPTKVLVTVFSEESMEKSTEVAQKLREKNISTQLWLDTETKLDKQLKYADQKGISFALIIGPDEAKNNQVTVKDLKNQTQETLSVDEALQKLSS